MNASSPSPKAAADDTIVACATGQFRSPRALIRVSGELVPRLTKSLLGQSASEFAGPHRFKLAGELALPCMAWARAAPRTYTGQHTLELLIPGNPLLVERVIHLLCQQPGVRRALPGEFTARAFTNARLTLDHAEAVAALIAAQTGDDLAHAAAVRQGVIGRTAAAWSDRLTHLLALVEVGIDFSDQEGVVAISPAELTHSVAQIHQEIGSLLSSAGGAQSSSGRPLVVLVGPPSAGKSTLFNALLCRQRAVVCESPGTTRDALIEPLTLRASGHQTIEIELCDLPGFDGATSPLDLKAQHSARATASRASLALLCDPTGDFAPLLSLVPAAATIKVRTKADRPAAEQTTHGPSPGSSSLFVCALTGQGLNDLRAAIVRSLSVHASRHAPGLLPRHIESLARTLSHLRELAGPALPPLAELQAHHLRAALNALGEVSGTVTPDDVIGAVFSRFCIGK